MNSILFRDQLQRMMVDYLSQCQKDILYLHHRIIEDFGGEHGVRDDHRLVSAASKLSVYNNPIEAAAYFVRGVIQHHPFIDGNKRTAVTVMSMYLQSQSYALLFTPKQLEDFAVDIALKKLNIDQIINWLNTYTR